MSDWTPLERPVRTPTGVIYYGGACKDDYKNMKVYDQGGGHTIVVLQGPALRGFKAAQALYAKATGWTKKRLERNPDGRPIIILAGSKRTCATQAALYRKDPHRYADPKLTGHTRGIAIDVDQSQPNLAKVNAALAKAGWTRARSDEPWHWSYGVTV